MLYDIEGNPRPRDAGWDIGPYEYQGGSAVHAGGELRREHSTSGTSPLTVNFTDYSTGGPTAWSWTFGDSNSSTVQNPSHTYSSTGTYTVALTATNSAGNNTMTKTNYISSNLLTAGFTCNVTANDIPFVNFGGVPLAVQFTDTTDKSPTAWSWTFGDGGTSTAQNPSHTYTSAGYYTVALTASKSGGSNTNTQANYIAACTEVVVYPSSYSGTLQSGSLSNLTTDDSNYMVFTNSNTTV